jgi:hypothetical protein
MKLLEEIQTKLMVAVMLKDDSTLDEKVIGPVYIRAGIRTAPVKHRSGYYLLLNVPPGTCAITAGGKYYRETQLTIDPATLDPKLPVVDMALTPGANHP